jgi:hypothetical protein
MRGYLPAFLLLVTFDSPCSVQSEEVRQNWFHYPFFLRYRYRAVRARTASLHSTR